MSNDFMEVMSIYGWTVYYFAGFVTGCIISIFVGFCMYLGQGIFELIQDLKEKKDKKNEKL